ncbi:hypothetical protein [Dolichospermum sp. UHCC 0259]|nr:hypothetical protein [Dolichospermum sp. UHCC 0259]
MLYLAYFFEKAIALFSSNIFHNHHDITTTKKFISWLIAKFS